MASHKAHLVIQHVEMMSRRILENHQEVIREYVKGKHGVYALYRGSRLYYVGLASNLRSRLKAHVRDRHAEAWDRFSLYLTEGEEHLRELEAMVLRITMPKGNRAKSKFVKSQDLRRYFKRRIQEHHRADLDALFATPEAIREHPMDRKRALPAAGLVSRRTPLRMRYRGKTYRSALRPDGQIKLKGKVYNSPSGAARSIFKRPVNGWSWWRYEVSPGKWVELTVLRGR
jgi:predicted GIY-YIG superfamily endonuclease